MAYPRLSVRKIKEILRLYYELGLTKTKIAQSVNQSRPAIKRVIDKAAKAGLAWPIPDELDDQNLEALLYPQTCEAEKTSRQGSPIPDWNYIQREMKRPHVTRQLLWQEYREAHPNGFEYSQFCNRFRSWIKTADPVMRQEHKAGEKMFVDYVGQTVAVIDPTTGREEQAQIFVAVLGGSNYTYCEATWSQSIPDWLSSHVRAFEFFGGSSQVVVPDNLKSAVSKACKYEPDINRSYLDLAQHYGVAVVPARPYKPKDKSRAENGVLLVERWILAALRNRQFFGLEELNQEIHHLLEKLNTKAFQKIDTNRQQLFLELEKPLLQALPERRYQFAEFHQAKVNIDYHVEFERHYYSVPHQMIGKDVELRITGQTIEVLYGGKRIASHVRSYKQGKHTTIPEHMPKSHQKHREWTPERILSWAQSIGPSTHQLARLIMESRIHPEQGFRSCLGIFRLTKTYSNERLEAACFRAIKIQSYSYRSIASILQNGLDRHPVRGPSEPTQSIEHSNIRGLEILS